MKIGRNEPCQCGSGKKYKNCFYLKEQNSATEDSIQQFSTDPNRANVNINTIQ